MDSYDENLAVNPFFVSLHEQGKDLYETIATNRWTICVPRIGTVEDSSFTEKDFLNHVLILDSGNVYNTLSNKVVTIDGSCISTGAGFEESRAVLILFEETYFNDKDESYQVLCINQPLEGGHPPEGPVRSISLMLISNLASMCRAVAGVAMEQKLDEISAHFKEIMLYMKKMKSRIDSVESSQQFKTKQKFSHSLGVLSMPKLGTVNLSDLAPNQIVHSIQDCANLLWAGGENSKIQRGLDDLISLFNRTCPHLEADSLRNLVDAANALFTRAMQTTLKDNRLRKNVKAKPNYMDHIKLAVETYMMHGVYRKLFKLITTCSASQDSRLNKITRNLAELQLRDLGVRQEFCYNVPWARRELANLKRYSTPLGKLNCIRRVVQRLQQTPHTSPAEGSTESSLPLTTDDLLPILVFLVVKAEMPNWWAHFHYMTCFRFAKASNDDEYGFYLATLEAALEHVGSGQLNTVEIGAENPQRVQLSMSPGAGSIWQRQDSSDSQTNILFQYARDGDLAAVKSILGRAARRPVLADIQADLCHPLCSCPKCAARMAELETDNAATVFSRDDRGCTVLHIAAFQGNPEMADYLLKQGAVVNAADYHGHSPLHVSCLRGHQALTLLMLHYKSDMNLQDNDGNSPLHLACANGHEECVKALVYYDYDNTQLNVNIVNDFGDTPLHLAAKWGYESIVEILWENGASVKMKNRKKQTPFDCAHSTKVARMLAKASEDRDRLIRRRNSENALRMTRSASLHATMGAAPPEVFADDEASLPKNGLPRSATLPPARRKSSSSSLSAASEHDRKVEKLLKAVADGDLQMARFHLGWTEDVLHEEDVDVTKQALCHPLCQCDKCAPIQQLSLSPTGVFVSSSDQNGLTPLHVAATHAHSTLVELFCKRGANVNAKTTALELTPLHCACQNNRKYTKDVVKMLLEHGAKVNQADIRGNTALHLSCMNGNKWAAALLIKANAKLDLPNLKGNAPLHEAARYNSPALTKLLLVSGASINLRNQKQQTPLHLAQNDKVLKLLLETSTSQGHASRSDVSSSRSVSVDSTTSPPPAPEAETDEPVRKVALQDLFAALAEKDLERLQTLSHAIRRFDRRSSLRHTVTRDRSAPRLDARLAWQLSIRHFDHGTLRRTKTVERREPVVAAEVLQDERERNLAEEEGLSDQDPFDECPSDMSPPEQASPAEERATYSSSVSSEESDIFLREHDMVKLVPQDAPPPASTREKLPPTTCDRGLGDGSADLVATTRPPVAAPREPLAPGKASARSDDCGSDAEADVFFRRATEEEVVSIERRPVVSPADVGRGAEALAASEEPSEGCDPAPAPVSTTAGASEAYASGAGPPGVPKTSHPQLTRPASAGEGRVAPPGDTGQAETRAGQEPSQASDE